MEKGLAKCKDSRNVQVTSCEGCDKSIGRCRWKGSGFMQPPLQSGKNVLYGSSPAGGNGKQVDDQFVHEVVEEKSPEQLQRFGIGNFGQIGKGVVFAVFLAQQVQNGMGQNLGIAAFTPMGKTFPVVQHPSHRHVIGFRKKPVQCHHRYCLYLAMPSV